MKRSKKLVWRVILLELCLIFAGEFVRNAGPSLEDHLPSGEKAQEQKEASVPNVRIRLTSLEAETGIFETLMVSCQGTFWLEAGGWTQIYTGGQILNLSKENALFQQGTVHMASETGAMQIISISGENRDLEYPGEFDLYLEDGGIVLINELSMETYAERVSSSELPAEYGLEASKVQVVCARSCAYERWLRGEVDSYGAIGDDTSHFQVYNRVKTEAVTKQAAQETRGLILSWKGKPVAPFYFSTSCGYTSDGTVWGEPKPWLEARPVTRKGNVLDLTEEKNFRSWIQNWDCPAYEYGEDWYRWNYTISLEALQERLEAVLPDFHPGTLEAVSVTKRLEGGAVKELLAEGSSQNYRIQGEGRIRSALGAPNRIYSNQSEAGSGVSEGDYLPSTFFCLEEILENGELWGYTVCGGGNGHGIGLSQHAAKKMIEAGMSWEDVINFFYKNVEISRIY